ncbi:DgyrCDS3807 [Dimorphilus gyrociliatus]|uniref:DgyrCDS3807 n=1 Tax=Dimorphilus gyrociliatus TaxID=2664684 RepID=A0A7I8VGI4_9ANNE|nr:DgyrCDS3807 [Dimorphilus gyrociliatus]
MQAILLVLQHFNWRKVSIIHESDMPYDLTMNLLRRMIRLDNMTLITTESFRNSAIDNLMNIKKKNGRIMVFFGNEHHARIVLCEAYTLNMVGPGYQWIIPGFYEPGWQNLRTTDCQPEIIWKALELTLTVSDVKREDDGIVTVSGQTYNQYLKRYTMWPTVSRFGTSLYHANAYDAVWAIALSLNASEDVLKNQTIPVKIGDDKVLRPLTLKDFTYFFNSEFHEVLLNSMKKTSFRGVSGHVSFTKSGNRQSNLLIHQFQDQIPKEYAVIKNDTVAIKVLGEIKWPNNVRVTDEPKPVKVFVYLNKKIIIVVFTLSVVGIAMALGFLFFNIAFRNHAHIKMSSPRLNNLITFGCILCYASAILFGLDGRYLTHTLATRICLIRVWAIFTGFTFAFAPMFAKTWRVHAIFTKMIPRQKQPLKDFHLITSVLLFWMIDVIILVIWTIINPFRLVEITFRNPKV